MSKGVVFISHIKEEAEIAKLLKTTLEDKFLGVFSVFVSSHPLSIKLGDKWFDKMAISISQADLVIVICSPLSEKRPWINFEAGCGFGNKVPVIPLCHSGLKPGDLSLPLNVFQGAELNSLNTMQELFGRIANTFSIKPPKMNDQNFFDVITKYETSIKNSISCSNTIRISAVLKDSITYLKYFILASVLEYSEITELNENDSLRERFSTIEIEYNKTYNLFNNSLLMANVNEKVYELLYFYINKVQDNIKFILTCEKYNQLENLEDIFDQYIISSSKLISWYSNIRALDKYNSKHISGIIEDIKNQKEAPAYRKSNMLNYFIDYYSCIKYLHEWINRNEATVASIVGSNG